MCNIEKEDIMDSHTELGDICWSCLYREVASHFEGDVGTALFDYYDAVNWHFFDNALPQAFLLTALTAYGRCIGLTKSSTEYKPIILIHPSLTTPKERFYTVLHEAIHVNVRYNLRRGKPDGAKTSHSTDEWLSEVNRIAKLLGYTDITIGYNKVMRVADYQTQEKKMKSKTQRILTGTVPYECSYHFPQALEQETGRPLPPIEQWVDYNSVTHN
jgi:hypothetical protein